MKNARKSSFSNLANYLTDDQGKVERVGEVMITNCNSTDAIWAAMEIEATQSLNTRATSDNTYHLLVSFREGEDLSSNELNQIETQLANALGFEEHQRVSVVHRDTDNLHIHMAINKIHPTKLTLHEPYRDHRTRDECCERIEREFNLERDNHKPRKSKSRNAADDMENMAGIESLLSHVQKLSHKIEKAESWQQLHDLFHEKGLEIVERGNGLVITNGHELAVKCSSVDRKFSKNELEKKLGKYQGSTVTTEPKGKYTPAPLDKSLEVVDLYEEYLRERHNFDNARFKIISTLSKDHKQALKSLKLNAKLKRQALRFADRGLFKNIALKHISKQLLRDIQKINSEYTSKRKATFHKYSHIQWQDWLRKQASEGNTAALKALRRRKYSIPFHGNVLSPKSNTFSFDGLSSKENISHVTTKGNVVYSVGGTEIRDSGTEIQVKNSATLAGYEAALKMSVSRFGNNLNVKGDSQFKTIIAKIAAAKNLQIMFTDPQLNRLKNIFTNNPTSKDIYHEQRRPTVRRNASSIRGTRAKPEIIAVRASRGTRAASIGTRDPYREYDNERLRQSNITKLGKFPPPQSRNNLRAMSKLGVVQFTQGSEVLLQSNVSHNVVEQRSERDKQLRWSLSRAGGLTESKDPEYKEKSALKSVDKYINERNTKRTVFNDISKHYAFNSTDAGLYVYSGFRNVDGQLLTLLKSDKGVFVLPSDHKTVNRLRKARIGHEVTVDNIGKITLVRRGVSR